MAKLHLHDIADGTAAPSVTFQDLCELGRSAREGYKLARTATGRFSKGFTTMASARSDAYDAALTRCLRWLKVVAREKSDEDAAVLEARYVDGKEWGAVAESVGISAARARSRADVLLKWLDQRAGFVV